MKTFWRALIQIEDEGEPRPATKAEIAQHLRTLNWAGMKIKIVDLDKSNVGQKEKK